MKNTMKVLLCLLALLMTTTLWVSAAEGNEGHNGPPAEQAGQGRRIWSRGLAACPG